MLPVTRWHVVLVVALSLCIAQGASGQLFNISTFAGTGSAGFAGDGGPATSARLNNPWGVAVDGSGNVYIAGQSNRRVRKVDTNGTITTFAGTGVSGSSGDGGAATSAQMVAPTSLAVDGSGNVYIADISAHRVRKVATNGIITTYAGNGSGGGSGDGGAATSAQLNAPIGIAVDGSGNLYIAEQGNNRVRKVATNGIITTFAGSAIAGFAGDGGAATSARLSRPLAVAADAAGNIYIADFNNKRVRKVATNGIITTVAGNGTSGLTGDGGQATSAGMNPFGLAIDGSGSIFITDRANRRVRKVATNGVITSVVGGGGSLGDGGPATSAIINFSTQLAFDGSGNLYIAEDISDRVRKVFSVATATVPSIPGATSITPTQITWTWQDNSNDETGFKVFADPGASAPTTLRTTTAANVTSWNYASLTANTQYAFQVTATNGGGDSAKTTTITRWTSAATPLAPVVDNPTLTTLDVTLAAGDGNPVSTGYAIEEFNSGLFIQADGTLTSNVVFQTKAAWGTKTVTGLSSGTSYLFRAVARNGALLLGGIGPLGEGTTIGPPTANNDTASTDEDTVLTVAQGGLFFMDRVDSAIQSVPRSGGAVTTIVAGVGRSDGIAVDMAGGKIYWADRDNTRIERADLNGSNREVIVSGLSGGLVGLSLDHVNNRVLWTDTGIGRIQVSNFDGTGLADFITGLTSPFGIGVDAEGDRVYWLDRGTSMLHKTDIDGAGLTNFHSGSEVATSLGLVIDRVSSAIYYVESSGTPGKLHRIGTGGGALATFSDASVTGFRDVAVDRRLGKIYLNAASNSRLKTANLDGTNFQDFLVGEIVDGMVLADHPNNVLTNDTDADLADIITVTAFDATSAQGAAVSVNANGTYTYDPAGVTAFQALDTGESLVDTFTYTMSDGTFTDTATVSITVNGVDDPDPTVSIGAPSTSDTTGGPVTYTVTYTNAAAVTLVTGDISLNSPGTATGTVAVSGSGLTTRTVTISGITGDGTLGISIAAGTASDIDGDLAPAAGPSATFNVDNTAPGVSIGAPSVTDTTGGPVTYTVTYTGASAVTLANGNVSLNGTPTGTVAVTGSGTTTRTVTISGITGNGTLGISIAAGTATDALSNSAPSAGPSATFNVDNSAPGISIGAPSATDTTGGPVSYTLTYTGASAVTLANGDVSLNGTPTGTVAVTGSGTTTRTVTISGITGDGTLGISIAAGTATDALSNSAPSAGPSATFNVDNTAPVVAVDALTTNDSTPALSGTVNDATASISVTVDGQTNAATNNGSTWSLADGTLTTLAPGTYDVAVTATDALGNAGADATASELTIASSGPGNGGVITSNLLPQDIFPGVRLELTAPAGGSGYVWKKDGVAIVENAPRVTGTTSQILVLDPLETGDAGNYTVVYEDGVSKNIVETSAFTIVVLSVPSLPAGERVAIGLLTIMLLAAGLVIVKRALPGTERTH